jgi:hypothetical protein
MWWKLFPFSLNERARQWYAQNIGKVAGDWEELRNKFCLAFYPLSRIAALRQEILNFCQEEKESLGAAWDRFTTLTKSGPDLSIPNHVLLQHFWLGLNKESALMLDTSVGGSFTHKTVEEGEALLDCNTSPLEPLCVELEPCFEEVSSAEAETNAQPETSSPEPDELRENPLPYALPCFDDNFIDDFGNYSKYNKKKINHVRVTPEPDHDSLKESIKELTAIMSNEWTNERESSSEVIQICSPS